MPASASSAAEIVRVVRAGGRVALTTWLPQGPVFDAVVLMRQALARVRPNEGSPPVNWGDPAVLERLLGPFGEVTTMPCELAVEWEPEALWERWERLHPMWIGARNVLEPAGAWDRLREASITALREGAIAHGAVSPYLLVVLDRQR